MRFPDLLAVRQRGRLTSKRMLRVDPWEKAADCERALRLTLDPVHRANLTNIREFWISLANERPFLSEHEFARQAEAIGRLHASLAAPASCCRASSSPRTVTIFSGSSEAAIDTW